MGLDQLAAAVNDLELLLILGHRHDPAIQRSQIVVRIVAEDDALSLGGACGDRSRRTGEIGQRSGEDSPALLLDLDRQWHRSLRWNRSAQAGRQHPTEDRSPTLSTGASPHDLTIEF